MNMKIKGPAIKFGNNIDTDVILPGKYLVLVDPYELAKHALESLDPAFPEKAKKGVIVVGGKNFGCGSSREQAPLSPKVCRRQMRVGRIVRSDFLPKRHQHWFTSNRVQRHIGRG